MPSTAGLFSGSKPSYANFHGQLWHGIKTHVVPRHCGDTTEDSAVKSLGHGFPMTGAHSIEMISFA